MDLGHEQKTLNAKGAEALEIKASIQQNLVKAEVYYQTLNVQSITQKKKYTVRVQIRRNDMAFAFEFIVV